MTKYAMPQTTTAPDLHVFSWNDQLVIAANRSHATAMLVEAGCQPEKFVAEIPREVPPHVMVDLVEQDDQGELTKEVQMSAAELVRRAGRAMLISDAG